ncbi:MAG: hypothetical protein PHC92_00530 [Syntrophomonadaceae bacterium]|nr:hypothetical protein [Syntrophomonadaceae bacterium]MDD3022328.1 hypothetical protein [Syntrophomonadaceae bacterium]
MDDLAKHLAHCLIKRLDAIEMESGMGNWSGIADKEIREEAMGLHERIRGLKRKLGQL